MKILVADDERDMADALEAMLRREHYSVETVYNGRDALDYGLSGLYDCLVLDLMMPGMDGLEVLTTLREHGVDTPAGRSPTASGDWMPVRTTISPSPSPWES